MLRPDQGRVLLRPFNPGDSHRASAIVARIMSLPDSEVSVALAGITAEFSARHEQLFDVLMARFEQIREVLPLDATITDDRRLLIGSCFLNEFSLESAALFNPSIVAHPDQSNVPPGALRFILSLRATGEGHISSITFRVGMIQQDHRIEVVEPSGFLTEPDQIPNPFYDKALFERKLLELGLESEFSRQIMQMLGARFSLQDLRSNIDKQLQQYRPSEGVGEHEHTARGVWMLAMSNYEVRFRPGQPLSNRIIFPVTPSQRNGIEDARFVRFANDDGTHIYFATFTAFDGRMAMPELVETHDFLHFRFITLNGPAAHNKGMAVFPRKVNGLYAMLSRLDNENIYVAFSDNMHFWHERMLILKPAFAWELVQIGNCGSPIETEAGWLVLSHGVGPLRKYCIGAFLLDRDDPTRVIGRLRDPLLKPDENEREGYVPNVVYTCGSIVHGDELIIPYGVADHATAFATVPVQEVLNAME